MFKEIDDLEIEQAKKLMLTVPRYSFEYNKLRKKAMNHEELMKFKSECKNTSQLARIFGYEERTIRRIISEFNIEYQIFSSDNNYRNGKPVRLYHPDDIMPFLMQPITIRFAKFLMGNKEVLIEILRNNEYLRIELNNILKKSYMSYEEQHDND